jgi:hypothetical protein
MQNTSSLVETAIQQLFAEYLASPVRFMRELGQQVRLRDLIQERLSPDTCPAQIRDEGKETDPQQTPWPIQRVQLEVKLGTGEAGGSERSDLAVFKAGAPVTLTRFPNGALDIVSRVDPSAVECVVELKAACSADKAQRHLFRKDIKKLWHLTASRGMDCHFVLIDKSLVVLGAPPLPARRRANAGDPVDAWHLEAESERAGWTSACVAECWTLSPKPRFIDAHEPRPARCVSVWDLAGESGELQTRRRWAVFD